MVRGRLSNRAVRDVSIRSLIIAVSAASAASILSTMAALATTRTRNFPGQTMIYALINQPLMVPEIVTGVALLIFFAMIKVQTGYHGLGYLIAAYTAFCIPFAYLPIRARLETMDLSLERAAADLYATPLQAFPPRHPAAAAAGHPRRLHARLRDLARRRGDHRICQIGRTGYTLHLHARPAQEGDDAGNERHRHIVHPAFAGRRDGVFPTVAQTGVKKQEREITRRMGDSNDTKNRNRVGLAA
jgi:hypothetical protein